MKENQFIAQVNVPFPYGDVGGRLERWVNKEHAGKPLIPLEEEVSEEHTDAHHRLHASHTVSVLVEVDKDGSWEFIEVL